MNETDPIAHPAPQDTEEASAPIPRRGPDLLTLLAGLGTLGIAGTALFGGIVRLPDLDPRWVIAMLALIVGLLLVLGSLRPPRR
ncbi:MAG: hypothetical protein JO272_14970 [Pseudonocardiales bacterium]|nr:hypothetical protein [Pseudonocardiales bacterium]